MFGFHQRREGLLPHEGLEAIACGLVGGGSTERDAREDQKAMYGTRDAAQNWALEYSEMMAEPGFT